MIKQQNIAAIQTYVCAWEHKAVAVFQNNRIVPAVIFKKYLPDNAEWKKFSAERTCV
jgi:hypothetical protein